MMAARSDAIKGFVHVKDEKGLLGYHLQLSKNHFVGVLPPNHYLLFIQYLSGSERYLVYIGTPLK